jgi:hypothetical protein
MPLLSKYYPQFFTTILERKPLLKENKLQRHYCKQLSVFSGAKKE